MMTKKKFKKVEGPEKKERVSITEKKARAGELKAVAGKYPVVALLNIRNLPDRILQKSKKQLRGHAEFAVAKNSTIIRALKSAGKSDEIASKIDYPTSLVFTDKTPYELFKFFKENKTKVAAKPGQIAPFDIIVPEGETDLMPGPALSELKGAGINAQIKGGKIIVAKDSIVAKKGMKISDNTCKALQKLNILPFEAMVNMVAAYDGKFTFTASTLDIDEAQLRVDLIECLAQTFNVSYNASFPTSQNIGALLSNAFAQSRNMAINGGIYSDVSLEQLLGSSIRLGNALSVKAGNTESQSKGVASNQGASPQSSEG